MEFERIHDPFSYTDKIFISMSEDEFNQLRFEMSIALAHVNDLFAINQFLYDSEIDWPS